MSDHQPAHYHDHDQASRATSHHEDDASEWDERYGEADRVWSGNPNGALVAEVEPLEPGRALDVGCGEGADAVWLAGRGWQVTAVDPSAVAIDRGRAAADQSGLQVDWRVGGVVDADLPAGSFDLVSLQYPALRKRTGGPGANDTSTATERVLFDLVAPGGLLLSVWHAELDAETAKAHGFDPADYVMLDDLLAAVASQPAGRWTVEGDEERERHVEEGRGSGHHLDRIVRLRRSP